MYTCEGAHVLRVLLHAAAVKMEFVVVVVCNCRGSSALVVVVVVVVVVVLVVVVAVAVVGGNCGGAVVEVGVLSATF